MSTGDFVRLARFGLDPYKCLAGAIIDRARQDCSNENLPTQYLNPYKRVFIMLDGEWWLRNSSWCEYLIEAFGWEKERQDILAKGLRERRYVGLDKHHIKLLSIDTNGQAMPFSDFARYIGVSVKTLRRAARRGDLKARKRKFERGQQWYATPMAVMDAIGEEKIHPRGKDV